MNEVFCARCGKYSSLAYQIQKNATKHLVSICIDKNGKRRHLQFLPLIEGLAIPSYSTIEEKQKRKELIKNAQNQKLQQSLF